MLRCAILLYQDKKEKVADGVGNGKRRRTSQTGQSEEVRCYLYIFSSVVYIHCSFFHLLNFFSKFLLIICDIFLI